MLRYHFHICQQTVKSTRENKSFLGHICLHLRSAEPVSTATGPLREDASLGEKSRSALVREIEGLKTSLETLGVDSPGTFALSAPTRCLPSPVACLQWPRTPTALTFGDDSNCRGVPKPCTAHPHR